MLPVYTYICIYIYIYIYTCDTLCINDFVVYVNAVFHYVCLYEYLVCYNMLHIYIHMYIFIYVYTHMPHEVGVVLYVPCFIYSTYGIAFSCNVEICICIYGASSI